MSFSVFYPVLTADDLPGQNMSLQYKVTILHLRYDMGVY
jgi:hypothetical protein